MAVSDSGTTYPATSFVLPGVPLSVTHFSGGKSIARTAVVDISPTTFLDRGSTRKTSTATATFLEHVAVRLEDTISLPNEETPRRVLKVINRFGVSVQADGRLTTCLLR